MGEGSDGCWGVMSVRLLLFNTRYHCTLLEGGLRRLSCTFFAYVLCTYVYANIIHHDSLFGALCEDWWKVDGYWGGAYRSCFSVWIDDSIFMIIY